MIYERLVIARYLARKAFGLEKQAACSLCQHAELDLSRHVFGPILADWGHRKHLGCSADGSNKKAGRKCPTFSPISCKTALKRTSLLPIFDAK
ncbi:MAG: hypothetical protein PHW63_10835 [Alphaproteobacteria bacterium]|nr:hypothetical protein [Alphaproteobacteria bacterium]